MTSVRAEKLRGEMLHDETWSWTLWRTAQDDLLLLDVVCGTVGIYERSVLLTPEETQRWVRSGPLGLDPLVKEIRNDVTGTRFGERYLR